MENIKAELLSYNGSDQSIAEAALVSSGRSASRTKRLNDALVKRLIRDGHFSCLEHVTFKFRIKAPYRILVQMLRHRVGMSYNMASARYGFEFEDIYYPTTEDLRCRSVVAELPQEVLQLLLQLQRNSEEAFHNYKLLVKLAKDNKENSPEMYKALLDGASYFLPQGTMCEMIVSCNLRSVAHFVKLRRSIHAQAEIQKIALDMVCALSEINELETAVAELGAIGWDV